MRQAALLRPPADDDDGDAGVQCRGHSRRERLSLLSSLRPRGQVGAQRQADPGAGWPVSEQDDGVLGHEPEEVRERGQKLRRVGELDRRAAGRGRSGHGSTLPPAGPLWGAAGKSVDGQVRCGQLRPVSR